MDNRRDFILLIALIVGVLLLALLGWLALPDRVESADQQPSSFVNARYGTKAAYLALEELGYPVARLRRSYDDDTLAPFSALVLIEPRLVISEYEQRKLIAWVRAGNVLLFTPPLRLDGLGMDWFGTLERSSEVDRPSHNVVTPAGLDVAAPSDRRFADLGQNALPWPPGLREVEVTWRDGSGPLAIEARLGEGRIIALADAYALSNEGLGDRDHALWLRYLAERLSSASRSGYLAFDEYHAGYPAASNTLVAASQLIWDPRWRYAILQAAAVAVLALWATGVRFGAPETRLMRRRRTQGEYTEAAARFLRLAKARDVVATHLAAHYRGRLTVALNLPPNASAKQLETGLAHHGIHRAEVLSAAVTDAPATDDWVQLAQQLEDALKELTRGT